MNPIAATPIVISVLLWITGDRLARRLAPRAAASLLTLLALVTALATGFVLAAACFVALAQIPQVAGAGHWSESVLRADGQVPALIGIPAGLIALALLIAAIVRASRAARDIASAAMLCRRLGPAVDGLVVIDDEEPTAYALPGLSGRIVVSTAMLRALPANERRALLAHETAHLAHRHVLYVQLSAIAAAANPLLRPLAAGVRTAVERWADEIAASHTGDRRVVARALARAGLARARVPGPSLAAADTQVAARIKSLLSPVPRHSRLAFAVLAAFTLASAVTTVTIADVVHSDFEAAQAAYAQWH